jgi:hypothetical protein
MSLVTLELATCTRCLNDIVDVSTTMTAYVPLTRVERWSDPHHLRSDALQK